MRNRIKDLGEQSWRSGECASLSPMWPGSIHMWFEFLVGSRLATRVFLRDLWFSSLRKTQHPQIPIRQEKRTCMKTSLGWCGVLSKYCDLFVLKVLFFFDQMMVALYDYNPEVQSPQDNPDSELPFKKGQVLTVVGEMVSLVTVKCTSM